MKIKDKINVGLTSDFTFHSDGFPSLSAGWSMLYLSMNVFYHLKIPIIKLLYFRYTYFRCLSSTKNILRWKIRTLENPHAFLVIQSRPTLGDLHGLQAPRLLSVGLFRQGHWSGLPLPLPGGLPGPGSNPSSCTGSQTPPWEARFTWEALGESDPVVDSNWVQTLGSKIFPRTIF